jgi:hypothetical protein
MKSANTKSFRSELKDYMEAAIALSSNSRSQSNGSWIRLNRCIKSLDPKIRWAKNPSQYGKDVCFTK